MYVKRIGPNEVSVVHEGASMELRTLRYFLAVAREENMTELLTCYM